MERTEKAQKSDKVSVAEVIDLANELAARLRFLQHEL